MTRSFDLDKLKQNTKEFTKKWQVKLNYLSESVSRDGLVGASHWLKSHHQMEELKSAIEDLLQASESEDFRLSQVTTTLSSFNLPEEDIGQSEWYKAADNWLTSFENKLINEKKFDINQLQNALKELKFISQAEDFHQRYQIQTLKEKVTIVYQNLIQAVSDFKILEQQKIAANSETEKLKIAELEATKAQAEAKKVMLETVKIKEKRLALIEEKKRRQVEKENMEAQQEADIKKAELQAKQAEVERQSKLQDAYVDLQIEEKINAWTLSETLKVLQKKLDLNSLDSTLQFQITEVMQQLEQKES